MIYSEKNLLTKISFLFSMFPKKDLATACNNLVLQLDKAAKYVIISDLDRPMICPEEVSWLHWESLDMEELTVKVHSLLEDETPMRVVLPVVQSFIGVLSVEEIIKGLDDIIDSVRGSRHILSIPTCRFVPEMFPNWSDVERLNAHLQRRHVEESIAMLLLHKSFLVRQRNQWVVCADTYLEYVTDSGLGHTLTVNGRYRYSSRILRFIASLKHAEPPCQVSAPVVPLPLHMTWSYVEKPDTAELLQSFGYDLKPRPGKKRGNKGKGKGEKQKGEGKAGGSGGVVTYAAPKPISVISIDEGTFKRVFRENCELRSSLKLLKGGLEDTESHVTKLMAEIKELKGELKGARAERDRHREESRRTSKKFRRLDESTYQDMLDWREERESLEKDLYDSRWETDELAKEVTELKEKLQREKDRYNCLEMKLGMWESWVNKEKKKDEKKRRKE